MIIRAALLALAVAGAIILWLPQPAQAIDTCLDSKENQTDCGDSKCNRQATSLLILDDDDEVGPGQSGYRPSGKCGWKFCGALICACGEPLSGNVCEGRPPEPNECLSARRRGVSL